MLELEKLQQNKYNYLYILICLTTSSALLVISLQPCVLLEVFTCWSSCMYEAYEPPDLLQA